MISPIFSSASQSIQRELKQFSQQAHEIATIGIPSSSGDLTQILVQTKNSEAQIAAAVKLLQAADETLGSLINIKV